MHFFVFFYEIVLILSSNSLNLSINCLVLTCYKNEFTNSSEVVSDKIEYIYLH